MTKNMRSLNHYTINAQFQDFVSNELLPHSSISSDDFWNGFADSLDMIDCKQAIVDTSSEMQTGVSLLNTRQVIRALNARWGSLYTALYNEGTIPHSTGLKATGHFNQAGKHNVARSKRVINYAKEFLDTTFPLTDGSHKDATCYMVYFQNLMIILADGSTVGLKTPAQFIAKSGPKSEPDSIVLRHKNQHVELVFDRNGATGSQDLAHIEDIQIEAATDTMLNCSAESVTEKCEVYANMLSLLRGDLQSQSTSLATPQVSPQGHRLNRQTTYTAKNGDEIQLASCNQPTINLQSTGAELTMVCDSDGNPLPQQLIDSTITSLIASCQNNGKCHLTGKLASLPADIRNSLNRLAEIPGMNPQALDLVTNVTDNAITAKDLRPSADTMRNQISGATL